MRGKKATIDFNGLHGRPTLPRTVIAELGKELEEDIKKFKSIKPDVVLERRKT